MVFCINNLLNMFKRKKKKTGCQTPEYKASPMPPVAKPKLQSAIIYKYLIQRGTTEKYKEYDPIIQLNELAVEYNDDKIIGYKLGDGATKWSELEYITNLTDIKEIWMYDWLRNDDGLPVAKIVLDPFIIHNILGGTEEWT